MTDQPFDVSAFIETVAYEASVDPVGVYEVLWDANGRYPSLSVSERLTIAERVVTALLAEGRVQLVRKPWITGDYEPVPDDEIAATLLDWDTWFPPEEPKPMIWLWAPSAAEPE